MNETVQLVCIMYINLSNLSIVKIWTNRTSRIDLYFYLDHCVVKKGGLSQKVLTAMQFSIKWQKVRQFETIAELSKKILAEYRFVPVPASEKKTAGVMCCWLKNSHQCNNNNKKTKSFAFKKERKKCWIQICHAQHPDVSLET